MVNQPSSDIYANTRIWFTRARPDPTPADFTSQLGCHFEEISEMCLEILAPDDVTHELLNDVRVAAHRLAEHLKSNSAMLELGFQDRVKFLDSIADQAVTGCGAAHCAGMDPLNALHQVNLSNWSKFDENGEPIRNPETNKILKGPGYVEADLTPDV